MNKSAMLSPCGLFRWALARVWDELLPVLCFIMLNPSTADAEVDDHTIRKCIGFATRLGFGRIVVVNLFALRSTDPAELYKFKFDEAVLATNDRILIHVAKASDMVICAWGAHGRHMKRGEHVLKLLSSEGIKPHALQTNDDGAPSHPLMLPYSATPFRLVQEVWD